MNTGLAATKWQCGRPTHPRTHPRMNEKRDRQTDREKERRDLYLCQCSVNAATLFCRGTIAPCGLALPACSERAPAHPQTPRAGCSIGGFELLLRMLLSRVYVNGPSKVVCLQSF